MNAAEESKQPTSSFFDGTASTVYSPATALSIVLEPTTVKSTVASVTPSLYTSTSNLSTESNDGSQTESPTQVILITSSVISGCLLFVIIITVLLCRRCRSKPKQSPSQGSDEGDNGLVINELYGAWGDSSPVSVTLAGDQPIKSTTNADAIYSSVDDFEGIAGAKSGDSAGRPASRNGNTYFTLEAPTKDGSIHYQASGSEYEEIKDERFSNGAKACGSMSDKMAFTLESGPPSVDAATKTDTLNPEDASFNGPTSSSEPSTIQARERGSSRG